MKKSSHSHFHVPKADLLCKNKCGFYGNTLWKGYCSKCYKELHKVKSSSGPKYPAPIHEQLGPTRQRDESSTGHFTKFEEKKKAQAEKKTMTMKSMFQRKTTKDSSSKIAVNKNKPTSGSDTQVPVAQKGEFARYLEGLGSAVHQDVSKKTHAFISRFTKVIANVPPIDVCSDLVQEFYQTMTEHFSTSSIYADMDETMLNELGDGLEKHIMSRLYNAVFSPPSTDDEEQDLTLHKRIRSLSWVTTQQLEANISIDDLGVRATLDKAITSIIEMDTRRAPKGKLDCIVNCSHHIFEALSLSSKLNEEATQAVASADDFLPVFIFIILKANPPLLKSNINYITRFASPARLNSGEGGYFFTNMCCVVDFVEKLNEEALNLTAEQFNSYMNGEIIPDGNNDVYMCEGLRLLHENMQMIDKIKFKQQQCMGKALGLQAKMTKFRLKFDQDINNLVTHSPLQLKRRNEETLRDRADSRAVAYDLDDDIPHELPSPLRPEQIHT